jgi:hypothetical protein
LIQHLHIEKEGKTVKLFFYASLVLLCSRCWIRPVYVYVATSAAEVERLKAEGIFFGVWVIDPDIAQDAAWGRA